MELYTNKWTIQIFFCEAGALEEISERWNWDNIVDKVKKIITRIHFFSCPSIKSVDMYNGFSLILLSLFPSLSFMLQVS